MLVRLLHTGSQVFGYLVYGAEKTKNRDVRSRLDNELLNKESVRSKEYTITASIGSSTGVINEFLDVQSLMYRADEMMYEDKKARKAAFKGKNITDDRL